MKKKSFVSDALVLCIITLISGLLLALVYEKTKEPISIAKESSLKQAYEEVLPGGKVYEDIKDDIVGASAGFPASLDSAIRTKDEIGNTIGYIMVTQAKGYGGMVKVIIGFDQNKKITGIAYPEVLGETPGLGMKVTDSKFYKQYCGRESNNFVLIKGGNAKGDIEIDAVSGATISSTAVNDCVNTACGFVDRAEQNDSN